VSESLTGFPRADGRWGVRNHVLVMPVRAAANLAAARIATAVGAISVRHEWDGESTGDEERLRRTFVGFATNPNVFSVLAVGVTDEDAWLAEAVEENEGRGEFISLVGCRGIAATIERGTTLAGAAMADARALVRESMSAAELVLGLECGGSDALSGITANPALGVASDLLIDAGGTSVLAETPELIGAEEILARRAISPGVGRSVVEVILGFEQAIAELGVDVRGAQPTPGNQAGGLTTIEEKSLGAAKKGGGAPRAGHRADGRDGRRRLPGGGIHHRARHPDRLPHRTVPEDLHQHPDIPAHGRGHRPRRGGHPQWRGDGPIDGRADLLRDPRDGERRADRQRAPRQP
jgi:altronate dehydratase large subunit